MSNNVFMGNFTDDAKKFIRMVYKLKRDSCQAKIGINHWMYVLLGFYEELSENLCKNIKADKLLQNFSEQLMYGDTGRYMDKETVSRMAIGFSLAHGRKTVSLKDVASVIFLFEGYKLKTGLVSKEKVQGKPEESAGECDDDFTEAELEKRFDELFNIIESEQNSSQENIEQSFIFLEKYGRDLTREARENLLIPVTGREGEIQLLIETLFRPRKSNPLLVGPAGVGKTAIVEGLAQRIVRGEVPRLMKDARLFSIQPSDIVRGADDYGSFDKSFRVMLTEASQAGVILFIDEIHTIIGAGGAEGKNDLANLLKPALARGDLSCIAATTEDEYRRYIESDAALERRFQTIRVQEATPEQTLKILRVLREELKRENNVTVPDGIVEKLVDFAAAFMRNRYFPDKAVDLIEQCVAYALANDMEEIDLSCAETVIQRMVGMPLDMDERIKKLREKLSAFPMILEDDLIMLVDRLTVTMQGFDLLPARPNAALMLTGKAAHACDQLAEIIAEALYGSDQRVVKIDFSRFVHPNDIAMLIGSPPGYVGYGSKMPMHFVLQVPWCVVCWKNVHACHQQIREVLKNALAEGILVDSTGKRIFLSDTIILMTAGYTAGNQISRQIGFKADGKALGRSADNSLDGILGDEFVRELDLIIDSLPTVNLDELWIRQHILSDLTSLFCKRGIELTYDESLVKWLLSYKKHCKFQRDWERLVDIQISSKLVEFLSTRENSEKNDKKIIIRRADNGVMFQVVDK